MSAGPQSIIKEILLAGAPQKKFYYEDQEKKLRGPHEEDPLQEWYRRGFFPSTSLFWEEGHKKPVTLAHLIRLNGRETPFHFSSSKRATKERELVLREEGIKKREEELKLEMEKLCQKRVKLTADTRRFDERKTKLELSECEFRRRQKKHNDKSDRGCAKPTN